VVLVLTRNAQFQFPGKPPGCELSAFNGIVMKLKAQVNIFGPTDVISIELSRIKDIHNPHKNKESH
jgi:hypothetical protein